jgi:hypothetical protein
MATSRHNKKMKIGTLDDTPFPAGVQLNAPTPPSAGHERRMTPARRGGNADTGLVTDKRKTIYR